MTHRTSLKQYFNIGDEFQYIGGRQRMEDQLRNLADLQKSPGIHGWVRIRFIVNCKGETDRFRLQSVDQEYQPIDFPEKLTYSLLLATKQLKGWKILPESEEPHDYYQYLIFKIQDGQIIEILP